MNNFLITICARGGSKGIPEKNIKEMNGTPLIAYTIKTAKDFIKLHNGNIELSTDSEKIREIASQYGLVTDYRRPMELATDLSGKLEVIKHLFEYAEKKYCQVYDFIIDMDITSPLRTTDDIETALRQLANNKEAINIFSVSPAKRNPYFNMVEESKDGFVKLVKEGGDYKSRQTAPKVYDMNASFYIFRRDFFNKGYETSITEKSLIYAMSHICFDLDEPDDFIIMDLMLQNNLLALDL